MWSIYDTLLLVAGVITVGIALLPMPEVPSKTRATAALIGGGLVVASLILGNLRSFTYPSIVFVGPFIALAALGVVVADARKRRGAGAGLQFDEQAGASATSSSGKPQEWSGRPSPDEPAAAAPTGSDPEAAEPPVPELSVRWLEPEFGGDAAAAPGLPAGGERSSDRDLAWAEANDPVTTSARLAEIVGRYPEFGPAVALHPNCYPELRGWIQEFVVPRAGRTP